MLMLKLSSRLTRYKPGSEVIAFLTRKSVISVRTRGRAFGIILQAEKIFYYINKANKRDGVMLLRFMPGDYNGKNIEVTFRWF
jgi:hypothetical protein